MIAPQIVEVALRDGLQNEPTLLSTQDKIALADRLAKAGATRIEAVSFVHPRLVPAMADAEAVMAGIARGPGVSYSGLVLNERGLDRALAAGVDEVNVVVCASDTFSRRNQNASREQSLRTAVSVVERARSAGVYATVTIATAFGCPFEGEVDPQVVLDLSDAAAQAGAQEICVADTIGVGVPAQVALLAAGVRQRLGAGGSLRFHFHNTRNTGYANAWEAARCGADALDSSAGGIGGCPFAPNATGNIATEDLAYLLGRSGLGAHAPDLAELVKIAATFSALLGKPLPALLGRAGDFPGRDALPGRFVANDGLARRGSGDGEGSGDRLHVDPGRRAVG